MDKTIKLYLDRIKELPEPNRGYLLDFKQQCDAAGTSDSRIREYLRVLIEAARMFKGRDMKKAAASDIDKAVADFRNKKKLKRMGNKWVETNEKLSEATVKGFVIALKLFYKRLCRTDEYPRCVKHMKVSQQNGIKVQANDILTYDEIVAMSEQAKTARDKALLWVWIGTGARASELMNIRRRDIKFMGDEAEVVIHTEKTQRRKDMGDKTRINSVIYGAQYLGMWIDQLKPKPDDFVFVNIGNKGYGKQMGIGNLCRLFKDIAKRAGIKKRVWVHLGRHTAASILARRHVGEAAMCKYLGWSAKSDMPRHYVHLSKHDAVDSVREQVYGKKTSNGDNGENVIKPCPKCNFRNLGEPEFCQGCGIDLKNMDVEKEIERRKGEREIGRAVQEMVEKDKLSPNAEKAARALYELLKERLG